MLLYKSIINPPLLTIIAIMWSVNCFGQPIYQLDTTDFRYNSDVLYGALGNSAKALPGVQTQATQNKESIVSNHFTQTVKLEKVIDEKIIITIYYRWDKDNLDNTYLTNTQTLARIDSLLHLKSADYIDSLRIVAYASPDGAPEYNRRLSERRANTIKDYLLATYPVAFRTNLLYDAVGAVNIGIELPFGRKKSWSFILDGAYSYWRLSKNLYALQTLEYGAEARYWFGANESRKMRNPNWAKPLKGWNAGVYGRCWQRYDVQWIDGYQGDETWSAGLTAGYAFPIGKQLSLEASVGGGWLSTSEYRHYHQPEYNADGKYHLMWQESGKWSGLAITKVRFSLVWLIENRKKGGEK